MLANSSATIIMVNLEPISPSDKDSPSSIHACALLPEGLESRAFSPRFFQHLTAPAVRCCYQCLDFQFSDCPCP